MAFSAITARGSAVETVSDASIAMSPSAALTVGKLVVVCVAIKNLATADGASNTVTGISDTQGHNWRKITEQTETAAGASNDGSTIAVFYTVVGTQIETTDTITATLSGSIGDKIICCFEATFDTTTSPQVAQVGVGPAAISASVSSLTSREYLLIGAHAAEGADQTKTPDADYTERFDLRSQNAATAITIHVQTRIATLTADTCTSTAWTNTDPIATLTAMFEETLFASVNRENHQTAKPTLPVSSHGALMAPAYVSGTAYGLDSNAGGGLGDNGAPDALLLLQYQSLVGPVFIPAPVVAPDYSTPNYPNYIWRTVLPTAAMPSFFSLGAPEHRESLDARGWYPDQIDRVTLPRAAMPTLTQPIAPEHTISLDAKALYPDRIDQIVMRVATMPTWAGPIAPEHRESLDAKALFPDWIDRRTLPPALHPFLARSMQPEHTIPLDAAAWFPDWIARLTLPVAAQPFFARSLQPEQTQAQVLVRYPDWIARRVLPVAAMPYAVDALSPAFPPPHLSWEPTYPDIAWRREFLAAWQQALVLGPSPIAQAEAPHLSWQGEYPDLVWRRVFLTALQQALGELTTPPQVLLNWCPVIVFVGAPVDAAVASGMAPRAGGS